MEFTAEWFQGKVCIYISTTPSTSNILSSKCGSSPLTVSYENTQSRSLILFVGIYADTTTIIRLEYTKYNKGWFGWSPSGEGLSFNNPEAYLYGAGVEGTLSSETKSHFYLYAPFWNAYWQSYYAFVALVMGKYPYVFDIEVLDDSGKVVASVVSYNVIYRDTLHSLAYTIVDPKSHFYVVKVSGGGEYHLIVDSPTIVDYSLSSVSAKPGTTITIKYLVYSFLPN